MANVQIQSRVTFSWSIIIQINTLLIELAKFSENLWGSLDDEIKFKALQEDLGINIKKIISCFEELISEEPPDPVKQPQAIPSFGDFLQFLQNSRFGGLLGVQQFNYFQQAIKNMRAYFQQLTIINLEVQNIPGVLKLTMSNLSIIMDFYSQIIKIISILSQEI